MKLCAWLGLVLGVAATLGAAEPATMVTLLKPARVFDGEEAHEGWGVLVRGDKIAAVGPVASQFHWLSSVMPKSSAPPRAV
jgi:hypothetical protein